MFNQPKINVSLHQENIYNSYSNQKEMSLYTCGNNISDDHWQGFSIALHFSDQSCFNSNSVYYNLPYTLIFFISFQSPGSHISQEYTSIPRKSNFRGRNTFTGKSHFPGNHISQEVTFPGKSQFPGSHISWEVTFPGKSHFPKSRLSREVKFLAKSNFPGSHHSQGGISETQKSVKSKNP